MKGWSLSEIAETFLFQFWGDVFVVTKNQAVLLATATVLHGYRDFRDARDDLELFREQGSVRFTASDTPFGERALVKAILFAERNGISLPIHPSDVI